MKDTIRKERQVNFFSGFESENGSQLLPSPASLQESKVLKAQVWYKDHTIPKIIFSMAMAQIIVMIFGLNTGSSIFRILGCLIYYLALLAIFLYFHTTVTSTHDKIIIRRRIFKTLDLRKEDIVQTSISKNKNHSYRWLLRLLVLAFLITQLPYYLEHITRDLHMEAAPAYYRMISVLQDFWTIAYLLVVYYIFELAAPYRRTLNIKTRSNLNLEISTEEPEKLMAILKGENE